MRYDVAHRHALGGTDEWTKFDIPTPASEEEGKRILASI